MQRSSSRPTLYMHDDLEGARVRFLLAIKDAPAEIVTLTDTNQLIALAEFNPDNKYPLLVAPGITAHTAALEEYIHERWPGPALLAGDPAHRAQHRMMSLQISGWYHKSSVEIRDHLLDAAAVYGENEDWFFGPHLTLVDVGLAPLVEQTPLCGFPRHFVAYATRLVAFMYRLTRQQGTPRSARLRAIA